MTPKYEDEVLFRFAEGLDEACEILAGIECPVNYFSGIQSDAISGYLNCGMTCKDDYQHCWYMYFLRTQNSLLLGKERADSHERPHCSAKVVER
ncbi:MAG: hypothetical protein IJJ14_05090 [Coriobacteriales bacterium]|nr:hypothetical protein [Coriobacteriales bacterium]